MRKRKLVVVSKRVEIPVTEPDSFYLGLQLGERQAYFKLFRDIGMKLGLSIKHLKALQVTKKRH